jgi:hypothetical protein
MIRSACLLLAASTTVLVALPGCGGGQRQKCVRGVVAEKKLFVENPWNQFDWAVEEAKKPIRQLTGPELRSFFDFLESEWAEVGRAKIGSCPNCWSCYDDAAEA